RAADLPHLGERRAGRRHRPRVRGRRGGGPPAGVGRLTPCCPPAASLRPRTWAPSPPTPRRPPALGPSTAAGPPPVGGPLTAPRPPTAPPRRPPRPTAAPDRRPAPPRPPAPRRGAHPRGPRPARRATARPRPRRAAGRVAA